MTAVLSYQLSAISNQLIKLLLAFLLVTGYWLLVTGSPSFAQTNLPSAISNQPSATNYELQTTNQYLSGQSPARIATQSVAGGPHVASMAIYNFSHAMSCILIGQSPIAPCLEYKMVKDATGMVRSIPYLSSTNTTNGVLGMSMSMIGEVISKPPIHSSLFLANLGEQIGIKSAHAQVGGSGSGVLAPIFKLWEVSRNIAYLAMILIFIIVGLMVMFRKKLNPQTVVSIQMALPGLVIGLVMITFSYFLASLISDMAFVGTNLVGYYFSLAQGGTGPIQPPLITSSGQEQNVLNIFSRYTDTLDRGGIANALEIVWSSTSEGTADLLTTLSMAFVFQITNQASSIATIIPKFGEGIRQTISALAAFDTIKDPRGNVGIALSWITSIILIYSMFKLLFKLITTLLNIIFLTISAPFQFLVASLPGKQEIATKWFFNMLCHVLVFPAIVGVFYFVAFILGRVDPALPLAVAGGTSPVSLGNNSTFPLLGGLDLEFLNKLLAFGALVASPSIPDAICKTVGKPGAAGGLLAGAVGGAMASGQRYSGQFGQGAQSVGERGGALWNKRAMAQVKTGEDAVRLGLVSSQKEWDNNPKIRDRYENKYVPTTLSYYGGQLGGAQKAWEIAKQMPGVGRYVAKPLGDKGTEFRERIMHPRTKYVVKR